MVNINFFCFCLNEVVEGLRDGLSHFSPPSRVALIHALGPDEPLRVHDPLNLLRGHEPRLEELYLASKKWRTDAPEFPAIRQVDHMPVEDMEMHLTGRISYSCWSKALFFQSWFTEEHPNMCSIGPTTCWLEYAARLLGRNVGSEMAAHLGTSGYVLSEYATHAVRDYIVDQRNYRIGWDTRLRIFPTLDVILGISKTVEEGEWPRGRLAFVDPGFTQGIDFLVRLPEHYRPSVRDFKHVRKLLLASEFSNRTLVSDGRTILGLTVDPVPPASLVVDFCGGHGFLHLDDDLVCSFADGRFNSSNRRANLVQVEEMLIEMDIAPEDRNLLYHYISDIVGIACRREHGCTLVIDPNGRPLEISGHKLEDPLDLRRETNLDLARALAKVDGALHIGADLRLHGFACLLDGHAVPGENRARGARFNSALRFTAEHPELAVVVVSADRPVSVIQGGVELTAKCEWRPQAYLHRLPPTLEEWIDSAGE